MLVNLLPNWCQVLVLNICKKNRKHQYQIISSSVYFSYQGYYQLGQPQLPGFGVTKDGDVYLWVSIASTSSIIYLKFQRNIYCQELNPELFDTETLQLYDTSIKDAATEGTTKGPAASTIWNTIKDLHMELLFMYHRVCLKLLAIPPGICLYSLFLSLSLSL